jgi:hypothetical protein
MFLYLKKRLPQAPTYQEEEIINIVKE